MDLELNPTEPQEPQEPLTGEIFTIDGDKVPDEAKIAIQGDVYLSVLAEMRQDVGRVTGEMEGMRVFIITVLVVVVSALLLQTIILLYLVHFGLRAL